MRLLPLALALAACSSSPPGSGTNTEDTGTTPTGSTAPGPTTGSPNADGEYGHVVMWSVSDGVEETSYQLLGVFAPNFDGLDQPAPCGLGGELLCLSELPATDGQWIDWPQSTFDPFDDGMTWIGDELVIGGFSLPFIVDPDTGYAGYRMQTASSVLPAFDVVIEGEWDRWVGEGVVPVANEIEVTEPELAVSIDLTTDLSFTWTPDPATTAMYLEVDAGSVGHRIWRLPDTGSATIPAADLPDVGGATVRLYRNISTGEHAAGDHTVKGDAWSVVTWPGLGNGPGYNISCKALLDQDPSLSDGVYEIIPDPSEPPVDVWCDMTTDGGGWTLVGSTLATALDDKGGAWYADLAEEAPLAANEAIWRGMRSVILTTSDMRFTCKTSAGAPVQTVDLSFYNVAWYNQVTTSGNDADSCFSPDGSPTAPPARRNNITAFSLPVGDQWNSGAFVGEDSCGDESDFTVDFDDRGCDSNQTDGTDWGEDDGTEKCGSTSNPANGIWQVWVREQ